MKRKEPGATRRTPDAGNDDQERRHDPTQHNPWQDGAPWWQRRRQWQRSLTAALLRAAGA